jgi:gliding motility-associated protein GldE
MDDSGPVTSSLLAIVFQPLEAAEYTQLAGLVVGMIVCLILSAVCSSGENAFFSHKDSDIEDMRPGKTPYERTVLYLLSYPKHLLATILVVNSLMAVCFVLLSAAFTEIIVDLHQEPLLQFFVDAIVVTMVLLVFGEVVPKVYATGHYRKVALWLAFPLRFFMFLCWPITNVLVITTGFLEKRIRQKPPELTPEELNRAIDITADADDAAQEKAILKGIVNIAQIQVSQIMKPRMDVVALDENWDFEEVKRVLRQQRFSRMPVYTGTLDQISGVLNMKDLMDCLGEEASFNWKQRMRPAFFVPENKKIDDLLHEFRKNRNHLAVVVDEFGGTQGIVTLEDVLEEVFGDMQDEFDEELQQYSRLDDSTWLFEGKTPLVDFLRICHLPIQYFDTLNYDTDTLAGIVTEIAGRIPVVGDEIKFNALTFIIDAADLRRVKRIKVSIDLPKDSLEQ